MTINAAGLTIMVLSISTMLLLLMFCLYKVFTAPPQEENLDG